MTQALPLDRLRKIVEARFGLFFPEEQLSQLEKAVEKRMRALGESDPNRYGDTLSTLPRDAGEIAALAEALTVTETFFFRSVEHLRVLTDVVVPGLRERGQRRLRVVCAGCASGEEPYSIAMFLRQTIPAWAEWDVQIRALDMNRAMLARARAARYSPWALRVTPDEYRQRYFRPDGRDFLLSQEIRKMVRFDEVNLSEAEHAVWRGLRADAVFCRNVMMYFSSEVMQAVLTRFARALNPDGYLFLGHAETLRGVSDDFTLCHSHDAFYYRCQGALDGKRSAFGEAGKLGAAMPGAPSSAPDGVSDGDEHWADAIHLASRRIDQLLDRHANDKPAPMARRASLAALVAPAPAPMPAAPTSAWNADATLELLRQERFSEALQRLRALPSELESDPQRLLLLGVVLTNQGARVEAEMTCRRLLELNDLHAGAHYLLALSREHAKDTEGAMEHDRRAIYVDREFAMPHLHLGLMAKRSGDADLARRELRHALSLLSREDESRLLLFGGGFSREALARVCRAELAAVSKLS